MIFVRDDARIGNVTIVAPVYRPGDTLWVRETYRADRQFDHLKPSEIPEGKPILYPSDGRVRFDDRNFAVGKLRPSIFMCRWMSRVERRIADVRIQRLQDITESDAQAEGAGEIYVFQAIASKLPKIYDTGETTYRNGFIELWDSLNEKRGLGWTKNPWVSALTLEEL